MATPDPSAVAEKLAIKVVGGQTIKSTFPLSAAAPAMIFTSSPREAARPFIFQLPATSGMMLPAIENPFAGAVIRYSFSRPPLSGFFGFYTILLAYLEIDRKSTRL